MYLYSKTEHGVIQWQWKTQGEVSPAYKSVNHQWWTPNKSDFEIITKLDADVKQEVKNEIWEDMQEDIQRQKDLYKLHKKNKKEI
tara:strand:- start:4405 stop:4659 length:255 start_codon:yes stop_codon:yes gene_type:complete